jgi:hypothetical protein
MPVASVRPNVRVAPKSPAPAPVAEPAREAPDAEMPRLPFRLRSVLVLAIAGGLAWGAYPRVRAAWQLHTSATNLANYALCMVGPTGPALLRDGSPQFRVLVRRRLISSDPADKPFEDCAKLALDLTGSPVAEAAHRAPASSFLEYSGATGERGSSRLGIDSLGITGAGLGELAREAWPFARGGYVKLVKPSLTAKEAVHPIEPARPGVGRGLPAWRAGYRAVGHVRGGIAAAFGRGANLSLFLSSDGGLSWRPAPLSTGDGFSERCPAGDKSYTLALSADARTLVVTSKSADGSMRDAPLARAEAQLVSTACDERGFVAALRTEGSSGTQLVHCGFNAACKPMALPAFSVGKPITSFPFDVARSHGATIVAFQMNGIVRVTSSRDDGRSWTPLTVAYDDEAYPDVRPDARVPSRLLAVGRHVLLYGAAAKPGQSYSVLVSDDLGASWRGPEALAIPVAEK